MGRMPSRRRLRSKPPAAVRGIVRISQALILRLSPNDRPVARLEGGAFRIHRVAGASVVATAVPAAPGPPAAPRLIIVRGTIWISRFDRRAIGAHAVLAWMDGFPCHRRSCQHGRNDCSSRNQLEFG